MRTVASTPRRGKPLEGFDGRTDIFKGSLRLLSNDFREKRERLTDVVQREKGTAHQGHSANQ